MKKIIINGFGRIGRCIFRNIWERSDEECVAINEPGMTTDNIIYLIKYDSIYGKFDGSVSRLSETKISVSRPGKEWIIDVFSDKFFMEGSKTKEIQADILIEASGREACAKSSWNCVENGIGHVIVTNTFFEADFSYVMGHNDHLFDQNRHKVISTSICDANATIPIISRLYETVGVEYCFVTTLHPWLSYQNLMDAPVRMQRKDNETSVYFPLGRASVETLIPKTTTLGPVLKSFFPSLEGKLTYFSYRVPTQIVASADMSLVLSQKTDKHSIEEILRGCDENIVSLNTEDIISADCKKESFSSIVDLRWLYVEDDKLKIVTWYDNEWGYSSRVTDLVNKIQ